MRSASTRPWTSPSRTPARMPSRSASVRSSSDVLPAPGALIRLTTVTPCRSKSSRLAPAIVLFASSASPTILTLVLCIRTAACRAREPDVLRQASFPSRPTPRRPSPRPPRRQWGSARAESRRPPGALDRGCPRDAVLDRSRSHRLELEQVPVHRRRLLVDHVDEPDNAHSFEGDGERAWYANRHASSFTSFS